MSWQLSTSFTQLESNQINNHGTCLHPDVRLVSYHLTAAWYKWGPLPPEFASGLQILLSALRKLSLELQHSVLSYHRPTIRVVDSIFVGVVGHPGSSRGRFLQETQHAWGCARARHGVLLYSYENLIGGECCRRF